MIDSLGIDSVGDDTKWRSVAVVEHSRVPDQPLQRIAVCLAAYVLLVGIVVLIGWTWQIERLTDWTGEGISMFPNTAIAAILLVIALFARLAERDRSWVEWIGTIAAISVALIGGATAIEHLSGLNLGIDTLVFQPHFGQRAATSPLRMGPPASISYLLLGAAVLFYGQGRPLRAAGAAFATLTLAFAVLSLTGYAFGADQLYGIARYTGISFATSTVIAAASIAVMCLIPEFGIVSVLTQNNSGGALLRRLIFPIFAVPLLLGWLGLQAQSAELFDLRFGVALRTLLAIAFFLLMIVWTARSISQHESAALRAQWRLAAIVGSSHDAIVSKSLHGVIESWNAGAEQLFGYKAAEVVGKHISIIIPSDRLNEEHEILRRIRNGEPVAHFETIRIRKDGQLRHVSLSVSPILNDRGEIVGASKIARDVTDRKQAEKEKHASDERLRAVVEATPECVKIVRADGSLEYMNQAGLRIIEADSESEVRGSCIFDLVVGEHRDAWKERHRRVCSGERLSWEFEIIGLRGARHWMETHAVPIRLADGQVGQLAVTREISARKAFEREREDLLKSERAARSDAERASQLKDDFLATLSHELRTPLNAVLGWSQILRRTNAPEDLEQGLEVIERNARLQAQLIDDLLDMSRIMSGKVVLDVQPTELVMVVSAALDSVRPSANAKEIRLGASFDPEGGLVVGDATRLQQIVWNLLTNAIKFTPSGGVVEIVVQNGDSGIELIVRDTGIGVEPDFLPWMFERFRQRDSSTTRRYGGLGLGLSIVKHLVELHGGSIRAESEGIGKGTSIVVTLPKSEKLRTAPLNAMSTRSATSLPERALQGMRILVVDDETDARKLVERVLNEYGAEVYLAASAGQAMEVLAAHTPHLILSDIGMPDMDGYQFIRKIRELPVHRGGGTPAIALTAFARTDDRSRALSAGFQEHVCKPIRPQELILAIQSARNLKSLDCEAIANQDSSL